MNDELLDAIDNFQKMWLGQFVQLSERIFSILSQMEFVQKFYRDECDPERIVNFILLQPNYTWMGLTIYPDEAWRYRNTTDWMWWRK